MCYIGDEQKSVVVPEPVAMPQVHVTQPSTVPSEAPIPQSVPDRGRTLPGWLDPNRVPQTIPVKRD